MIFLLWIRLPFLPCFHAFTRPINVPPDDAGVTSENNEKKRSVRPEHRLAEENFPGCIQSTGDCCYHCGHAVFRRLPEFVKRFFTDACPTAITNFDGGVEKTFCFLLLLQLVLLATFGYVFATTFVSCLETTYLSLDEDSGECSLVPIQISGSYYLDDNGFWGSSKQWAFSKTMLKAVRSPSNQYPALQCEFLNVNDCQRFFFLPFFR